MNANLFSRKIEMTKTEAKAAGKVGTPEYNELNELMARHPSFEFDIRVSKSRDNMKGLTAEYMEKYIKNRIEHTEGDEKKEAEAILIEFYDLRGQDENGAKIDLAHVASYGELKQWFLLAFPEVENLQKRVSDVLKNAKQRAADKKRAEAQKNANNQTEE